MIRKDHFNQKLVLWPQFSFKILFTQVNIKIKDFCLVFSSENYLDSFVPLNYEKFSIDGYNVMRSDHPNGTRRWIT